MSLCCQDLNLRVWQGSAHRPTQVLGSAALQGQLMAATGPAPGLPYDNEQCTLRLIADPWRESTITAC